MLWWVLGFIALRELLDPRQLVAHYRELQERHRERLVSRPIPVVERRGNT